MFSETSGSMYEEIERARKKKLRQRKLFARRITAIVILVIVITYLGLLLNDIRRFHNGDKPLITLKHETKEYDDGKVETYKSIGWLFRYYTRETIKDDEIAPFWAKIKMDNVLNRATIDPNLPQLEEYKVPKNPNKYNMVDGVLFLYDNTEEKNLLGTYKCILSEEDCEKATSQILNNDEWTNNYVEMDYIENRYAFILEYKSKNTQAEEKHYYLFDITANRIIAEYQDVRYSILQEEYQKQKGLIENNRFIVKKNDFWGIDEVNKGYVTNYEDYKYKFLAYDSENKIYKMQNTSNEWSAFEPIKRVYTTPIKENVDSIYIKNDKIYIVAYKKENYHKTYLLYNEEGVNVLTKEDIDDLKAYDKFLVYTKDDYLYVIDYDGKEVISSVHLYFTYSYSTVKPYKIRVLDNTLIISTPQEQKSTYLTDEYYYNINDWSLTKVRRNVQETT